MPEEVQTIVVGAGVVGLAIARALALSGREVVILEEADAIGTGISSRNSEVIHAGIYYPKDSLKARFCVAGKPPKTPKFPRSMASNAVPRPTASPTSVSSRVRN